MSSRGIDTSSWRDPGFELTTKMMRKFVQFYVFRKNPRFLDAEAKEKLPTTETIQSVFKTFWKAYEQETKKSINLELRHKTKTYIEEELPKKFGVSADKKKKHVLSHSDLNNLIAALWCSDLCKVSNGRQRVQLTLFLLLNAYTGARAGTFIESCHYKGSKRCLTYKVSTT